MHKVSSRSIRIQLVMGMALLTLAMPDAQARRGAPGTAGSHSEPAARGRAERLRTAGATALAEHDLPAARKALDESYERYPASESLYYLGQLALAEGHPIEAQDLMRRFLHELGPSSDSEQHKEATRILLLPVPPSGELEILGARGALFRVDGRLLGVLPLSQPILVASGPHTVQLSLGSQRLDGPVEIRASRTAQLRFDLQTNLTVVTLPPTVLLVQDYRTSPAPVQDVLLRAAAQAVRAEQHAVLPPRAALVRAPELTACVRTRSCQVQLMLRNEVDYTLALSLVGREPPTGPAGGATAAAPALVLHGELLEAAMGEDVALAMDQPIDLTTPEPAAALVGGLVTRLLKEGRARPRGTLEVTSTPPGADVAVTRGVPGVTPYTHAVWAGSYEVVIQKVGYKPARLAVNVEADKKETAQVTLEALPGPPPARPLWRTVTGAVAVGLGGTMLLTASPSLFSGESSRVATGAGVSLLGAAVAVGGVLLLTLPVARPKPAPPAKSAPRP